MFGLFIRYSSLPEMNLRKQEKEETVTLRKKGSIWDYPYLILGVWALFFHVGTQVIAIDTIIGYAGKYERESSLTQNIFRRTL